MESPDSGRPSAARRAYGVLYLMTLLMMAWYLLPEHRRQQMKLRLLRSCGQATRALARRTGAASLRHEALTGVADYALPYRLSLARERFDAAYDRARAATL